MEGLVAEILRVLCLPCGPSRTGPPKFIHSGVQPASYHSQSPTTLRALHSIVEDLGHHSCGLLEHLTLDQVHDKGRPFKGPDADPWVDF